MQKFRYGNVFIGLGFIILAISRMLQNREFFSLPNIWALLLFLLFMLISVGSALALIPLSKELEDQRIEAYQIWSQDFDKAKYDIYAVLGQKGRLLTWGKPHKGQPINLVTFSLDDVQEILLSVDDQIIESDSLPDQGKPSLLFHFIEEKPSINIPFTDIELANKWLQYLQNL